MERGERVVAVVQARMGSKRFPAKMMQPLGAYPIIEWVLTRVQRAHTVEQTVLATSAASENDVLEEVARRLDIPAVQGDEDDVLGRYVTVAKQYEAEHVVRVCGDNPFVSPEEIDRLVRFYLEERPQYAFNHIPRMGNNYPDGLGAEIFPYSLLEQLDELAVESRYGEHVTLYLWDHAEDFRIATFRAPEAIAFPNVKLDIDTKSDLDRLRKLSCVRNINASAQEIVRSYRVLYLDEKLDRCF